MSNQLKNLRVVNEMLILANQYSLTAEVILTCINLAKQYPEASVTAIILEALNEWDCYPEALVTHEV